MNNRAKHTLGLQRDQLPFLCAALVGLCFGSLLSTSHAASLALEITNLPSTEGQLMIEIVRGEAGFKDEEPAVAQFIVPASAESVSLSTNALPSGEYGVRVLHDIDGNGEMNTNVVGMPTEPWAFSNNAKGRFGPPKWQDVKFTLDAAVSQTINLVH